jgi:hypothetical protein
MRTDLFTHPKVVRISSALKADTLRTVGGLMSVWSLFDVHSIDGTLDGYTMQTLDDHLRWPGFSAAMSSVLWLEENEEGLVLPEFDTHNGTSAKRRAQDADRKKEVRKASATEADKNRTREEKRREDIKTSSSHPPCVRDPDKFQMHIGWNPSEEFTTLAKMAMVTVAEGKLGEFIAHWLTQPHQRTQAEWDKAFLQSAKHDALYTASTPQKSESSKPGGKFNPTAHINRGADDAKVINVN